MKKNYSKEDFAIGIDFGTTNSVVAMSTGLLPNVISNGLIPSSITINSYNIRSIKRLLGLNTQEIEKHFKQYITKKENAVVKVKFGNSYYSPASIAILIFKKIIKNVHNHSKINIKSAVLTVPAYFDDNQKSVIRASAENAGINILRVIAEPTAAAYAYGINKTQGTYLVYDMGGGTFDLSLVKMHEGILQVIKVDGDNFLGGDDIDFTIAQYLGDESKTDIAKSIKEALSEEDSIIIDGYSLTKDEARKISEKIVTKTIDMAINIIKGHSLDGVILVGGSTKYFAIRDALENAFDVPIFSSIDPEKVVAYGASMQAENLMHSKNNLVIDVLPLSIGIELYGGFVEKILHRNTPVPSQEKRKYTTYADFQNGMSFHVVQGEREMAKDCRSLFKFELKNLPLKKAGLVEVEISFCIDCDGILSVVAQEAQSKNNIQIDYSPNFNLNPDEIESVIDIAMQNADSDHKQRVKGEAIAKIEQIINNLNKISKEAELSVADSDAISNMLHLLKLLLMEEDGDVIQKRLEGIIDSNQELVNRVTKLGIQNAVIGVKI